MDKKLYKSSNDRVLAGVCGGIGEYFAVDSVIIRLLWVVFTFMGGAGLIAYIVAAIIIPESSFGRPIEDSCTRYDNYSGPEPRNNSRNGSLVLGIILILFGGFVLLKDYIPFIPGDIILAAIFIGLGIYFLVRKR